MTNQEAGYQRFEHCTHPGQDWCDCDWCRFLRLPAEQQPSVKIERRITSSLRKRIAFGY